MATSKKISHEEAQALNRHERRRLGKANGVKINGSTKPYIKPTYSLTTFTGKKV